MNPFDKIKEKAAEVKGKAVEIETAGKAMLKSAFGHSSANGAATGATDPEALTKAKERFEVSRELVAQRLDGVKKQPGAREHRVAKPILDGADTILKDAAEKVGSATTLDAIKTQNERVVALYDKAVDAERAAKPPANRKKFETERNKALDTLASMRKLPGAEVDASLKTIIEGAKKSIDDATTKAGAALTDAEVNPQIEAVSKIADSEKAAKTASTTYLSKHPSNLGDFEKKLQSASDRLTKVRSRRGADTHPDLKKADDLLALLKKEARAAANPAEVNKRIERLKEIEPLAKNIEKAAEEAKKNAGVNLDTYPQWSKMLASAQAARSELEANPVAKLSYEKLCKLIIAAETTAATKGAVAAVAELKGYEDIVKFAREVQDEIGKLPMPKEVTDAANPVKTLLVEHAKLAPDYAVAQRGDSLQEFLFLGRTEPVKAVTELGKLEAVLKEEIKALKQAGAEVDENLKKLRAKLSQMKADGLDPSLFDFLAEQAKRAEDKDIPAHNWQHANEVIGRVLKDLDDLQAAQGASSKTWLAGAGDRDKMRKRAVELVQWPPVSQQAVAFLADLREVETSLKQSGDYTAAATEFKDSNFAERIKKIEKDYEAHAAHPATPEALLGLAGEAQAAKNLYKKADEEATSAVYKLEEQLNKQGLSTANHLRAGLQTTETAWLKYLSEFSLAPVPWKGFANPTGTKAADLAAPFTTKLTEIKVAAEKAGKNSQGFTEFQNDAKTHEAEAEAKNLPKAVLEKLDELESMDGPQPDLRKEIEGLKDDKLSEETRSKAYTALRKTLQARLDEKRKENAGRVQEGKRDLALTVDAPLKKIRGRHKGFEDYQRELESQAADIAAMVESGDPFLLEASKEDTDRLTRKVSAVDPKQRGAEATRYKEVRDELDRLGGNLGNKNIREYLPTTHRDLEAELVRLTVEVHSSSPAMGLQLLGGLSFRIDEAKTRADIVRRDRELYKERKDRVKKQWARVKKLTGTRITDKTDHFADAFDDRLAKANAASRVEADAGSKAKSGPARGIELLAELEATLSEIESSGDGATARGVLQKKDAAIAQEIRAVQDLARDFEAQVEFFKKTTIPEARKIIEEQKGDLEMLKHLELSIKQASRPVQPYLDMLSALPRPGKPKAPELKQAKVDFKTATSALIAAARTVLTLRAGVGDTGMDISGDLKKVEANWRERAKKYSDAVVALAEEITGAASKDSDAVKENAAQAAKMIKDVADDFRPDAFAAQIHILTDKNTAKGKDKPRLAAREKVLKAMRANRKTLLEHPVHTQLTTANTAFKGSKVHAAARDVLIALKRLEIEVLVGI